MTREHTAGGSDRTMRPRGEDRPISRRAFTKRAGLVGAAGLAAPAVLSSLAWADTKKRRARKSGPTPLEHVIISCQENRSFDHYFGYAKWVGEYGPPPGYFQPDGHGGKVFPHHFTHLEHAGRRPFVGRHARRVEPRPDGRLLHHRRQPLHGLLHRR